MQSHVHGPVNSNEIEFVLRAAVAGAGIAAISPPHAREAIARGELEIVLPGHHLKGSDLHVVLPSSALVPARVSLLRDHLVRDLSAINEAVQRQCSAHAQTLAAETATPERGRHPRRVKRR
ncbi:MAG TPA: LysR substrate-binding domain-containing protein [Polyangiales bacterium]